jgi:hypothetical protein
MLLVASETNHVYMFATRKLQPMLFSDAAKTLIATCLDTPDNDNHPMASCGPGGGGGSGGGQSPNNGAQVLAVGQLTQSPASSSFNGSSPSKTILTLSSCQLTKKEQVVTSPPEFIANQQQAPPQPISSLLCNGQQYKQEQKLAGLGQHAHHLQMGSVQSQQNMMIATASVATSRSGAGQMATSAAPNDQLNRPTQPQMNEPNGEQRMSAAGFVETDPCYGMGDDLNHRVSAASRLFPVWFLCRADSPASRRLWPVLGQD